MKISKTLSVMFLFAVLLLLGFIVIVSSEPEPVGGLKHEDSDYYHAIQSLHLDAGFRINCSEVNRSTQVWLPSSVCAGCCDVWDKRQLDYLMICTTYDEVHKGVVDHCGAIPVQE